MNIILPLPTNTLLTRTSVTPALGVGEFIFFTEKKKNIIIDGIFTKILYSTPYFTMTGLYIQFQICSKFSSDDISNDNECLSHKTYMQFNPSVDKNKTQIESICEIETHILNVYSKTQLIHHPVTTPYATQKRGVSEALVTQSVGVRGLSGDSLPSKDNACEAGVSGWRPETPTGLSGDGLPSKDNKTPVYGLKTQLYSGCIRAFSIDKSITNNNNEDNVTSSQEMPFVRTPTYTTPTLFTKYIKISGVWETDQAYGITYKVFTE
jgi:hypothetical protein